MAHLKFYFCEECKQYITNRELDQHSLKFPSHNVIEMFSDKKRINLSKFLSLILRHKPDIIGIKLKVNGYTEQTLDELIEKLRERERFKWVDRGRIEALIDLDRKGRFEISNNRIRARYGHSISWINIELYDKDIPNYLYHGTNEDSYSKIKLEGLKPMGRNLVHLTSSLTDAKIVGRRHKGKLVLLKIDAKQALEDGIDIWKAGKNVYVSNFIPNRYITQI